MGARRSSVSHALPATQNAEFVCLVRAADGKRKIAAAVRGKGGGGVLAGGRDTRRPRFPLPQVTAKEHARFVESYGTILRAHMDGLKKKEKKKR